MKHKEGLVSALDVLNDLPVALRFVRSVRGLSLWDVATESGVHFNTVSRTERGLMPNIEHALALARWTASVPVSSASQKEA